MPLSTGMKLGPYEILAPLGAGGMGEVYRARDDRIGRDVAVKVLPTTLAQTEDRLRRFEQEARAAGRLNHPNVLTVHDVGTHDGVPYVVSELLEGETLRERLGGSGLPVRKATEIAVQIARGLAAAHEQGIVHRDLKPENVFVVKDGQVKILDFGLAKLTQVETDGELSQSPTDARGTDAGTVLGTVGYMSPEQVRGGRVDHRSDIFSLGAILYELLTGHRAFRRETSAETMAAILREDPLDLKETNRVLPPALERIVSHCLEKQPQERFQSARDLAFDLSALSGSQSGMVGAIGKLRPFHRVSLVAALMLALAAGLSGLLVGRSRTADLPTFKRLTFRRGSVQTARFAADGQTIVYSAAWDGRPPEVFSTRLESTESRALGFVGADFLSLSSQGEMALRRDSQQWGNAFLFRGTLARAPLAGGAARDVSEDVVFAEWSPDGSQLAVARGTPSKRRLEFPVGTVVYETEGWISEPRVSPGGDLVALIDHPYVGDQGGSVLVVDRQARRRSLSGPFIRIQGLAWSPRGNEVWFTATRAGIARALLAVDLSGKERVVARQMGAMTLHDIFRDGRVLLAQEHIRRETKGRPPGATRETDLSWSDYSVPRGITEDGKLVAFGEHGEAGGALGSVYVRATDGGDPVRLAAGTAESFSPDGRWVASSKAGESAYVLLPTGTGEPRSIEGTDAKSLYFMPDGKRLLLEGAKLGEARVNCLLDLAGGPPRPVLPGVTPTAAISPDGRFVVAFDSNGKPGIYPLEGGTTRPIVGLESSEFIQRWSGDGRSLFVGRQGIPKRLYRLDPTSGTHDLLFELNPADPAGVSSLGEVYLTEDGRGYVYSYIRRLSDLYLAEGLK